MTTERKLTARSVVLSVLLGSDPPRLPVGLLVRTTELFGISEGTTRVALSRMAASGEVVATDGSYQLAGDRLLARRSRQATSRAPRYKPWNGSRWLLGVVGTGAARRAAARADTRAALRAARLAELREGVWLRPDNVELEPIDDVRWFRAVPDEDAADLAARLWDLDGWAATADDLRRRIAALGAPLDLAEGFVVSAAVLRHLQADPLLPPALLPPGWPGGPLRADYDRFDAAYRRALRSFWRQLPVT